MDYNKKNKKLWDNHFQHTDLNYPNEDVVRFFAKCKKLYPNGTMLDWGCAVGRHTVTAIKFGFNVIGTDYVENCVNITKTKVERLLESKDFESEIKKHKFYVAQDVDVKEIAGESLDFVLMWGVLFYSTIENQKIILKNINRMLKKGGRVYLNTRTPKNTIYINTEKVDEYGIFVPDGTSTLDGTYMTFIPLEKLNKMFEEAGFIVEDTEISEFTQDNMKTLNSWYQFTLLKK